MTTVRVLVLSAARPLRAQRIAERISGETPEVELCGVVQQALCQLPSIQQRIATGDCDDISSGEARSKFHLRIRRILGEMVHWLLWCAHGFPHAKPAKTTFTVEDLQARCGQSDWPFLHSTDLSGKNTMDFVARQRPNLIMVLGEPSLSRELLDLPSLGSIQVRVHDSSDDTSDSLAKDAELTVECYVKGSDGERSLASLNLPGQIHDRALSKALKRDLIADDLSVQAVKSLSTLNQAEASKEIQDWMRRMLSPYLDQFRTPTSKEAVSRQRYRSILRLCAESLLFVPWVIVRNSYRRLRRRYPVLILTHHLVADRPHVMGVPTEDMWRRIRFLQRHYRIVSLSEAESLLSSGNVSVPTVVLTFDDGYCDNYITLRAVVEETRAKIVMFLATDQVELHKEFDHDLVAGIRNFFPLSWDQVDHWNQRDVEFGSHTCTHIDCGSRDRARLQTEVAGSARDLEMRLRQPCRFFAFPFGKRENMSAEAVQIAAATYSTFVSSYGGENLPRKGHREQHLLRKGFYPHPWELELELQSVFDLVQSARMRATRMFSKLRPNPGTARSLRQLSWTLWHACLLLLAILPPFRRMLDDPSGER